MEAEELTYRVMTRRDEVKKERDPRETLIVSDFEEMKMKS